MPWYFPWSESIKKRVSIFILSKINALFVHDENLISK